jgi:RimJ/RimL family protein N-acetyltransferase
VPRPFPPRTPLAGERVRLEPLEAVRHGGALHAATDDPALWSYLPSGPFTRDGLFAYLEACEASVDPQFFAFVVDGQARGMGAYLRIEPAHGVIEIGHLLFGAGLARTAAATEAIFLLAGRAFDELGYRRLEWKCNAENAASRRAAERFGFIFEGVFRQHMIVKGRNRDSAWYAIIDGDWPAIRTGFERWLAPENFSGDGAQRATLAELRANA